MEEETETKAEGKDENGTIGEVVVSVLVSETTSPSSVARDEEEAEEEEATSW